VLARSCGRGSGSKNSANFGHIFVFQIVHYAT
jgi:hypothetical protein